MKYQSTYQLLFLFLLLSNYSKAQSDTYPVLSMDVQTVAIANNTSGGLPDLDDSTIFSAQMHISVFDTTNIEKIYVNLGDVGNAGNRLQQIFDWDVSGSTGNGTRYSRSGYNLTLDLGNFMGILNYEAGVSIKRTDGSFTDVINFSR